MRARTWLLRQVARPVRHLQSKKPAIPGEYTRLALDVSQQGSDVTIQCVTGNALQVVGLVARAPDGSRIEVAEPQRSASEHGVSGDRGPGDRGPGHGGSAHGRSGHAGLSTWTHRASVNLADLYQRLVAAEALDAGLLDSAASADSAATEAAPVNPKERTVTFELAIFEDRLSVPKHASRIQDRSAYASRRFAMGSGVAGSDAAGSGMAGQQEAHGEEAHGEDAPGEDAHGADAHGYWAPLGRFRNTRLRDFDVLVLPNGVQARLRVTTYGHLTVVFGDPIAPPVEVRTDVATTAGGVLAVQGVIQAGSAPVEHAQLVIAGRHLPLSVAQSITLTYDPDSTLRRHGRRQYTFAAEFDLANLIGPDIDVPPHALADLWLELTETPGGPVARRRVGRVPYEERVSLAETSVTKGDVSMEVIPYFTVNLRNISLILEQISTDAHRRIDAMRRASPASRVRRRAGRSSRRRADQGLSRGNDSSRRPVWLLGERPDSAQDNGLHLFRYLRSRRPDIDAYYVITADSPDRKNLAGLDHVIEFGSVAHVEITVRADRIVGTHHADYLYPTRSKRFTSLVTASSVFLQHGVMGTKWMVPTYGKFGANFHTELVCASSERERSYLIRDFGYRPDEVQVTGLARFDSLFATDVTPVPGQILVMPTWRDWLASDYAFESSDYLAQWRGFLQDPRLANLRETTGATVLFYLHSNMRQYAGHFRIDGVQFVFHGDRDIQDLLKESSVFVTDYSSPSFDFAFLDKPVIYFQFDRGRFLGKGGSHLFLDAELPGFIATGRDQVLRRLSEVLQADFSLEHEYPARADRFIEHRDRHNCERTVHAIESLRRQKNPIESVRRAETYRVVERRARQSKFYFPAMRWAYQLMRRLPMDRNLVVFESGVGKQFSDSPQVIYDELRRRGDPRRRVWIYDRTLPVDDPQLTTVKRFTPRYFYYLARAKFWVTNQNFPHYITRRPKGVYLQTWHGTPLKRMLHDLDQVIGRDDGYLDRVSEAVSQWTHLLSPSPYATAAFRSAFRYQGRVLELGYPRNDVLVGDQAAAIRRETRRRLGIAEHQRVLLYAPTFRDNQKKGKRFSFEMPFDLGRFAREFGGGGGGDDDGRGRDDHGCSDGRGGTVLLLRMHLLVGGRLSIPESADGCVQDVSTYPDVAELYLAADGLITDYSSVMFDFALTGRPIMFFPYDLDLYRDEIRGFYMDYSAEMPGPIALDEDALFDAVRATADPDDDLARRVREFAARFAPNDDGHSAARVVDAVFT